MNNILKRPFFRQVERWLVSLVMAAMAFVIEKALLRSIRRGEAKPLPHDECNRRRMRHRARRPERLWKPLFALGAEGSGRGGAGRGTAHPHGYRISRFRRSQHDTLARLV
jgi:hypothetical protein